MCTFQTEHEACFVTAQHLMPKKIITRSVAALLLALTCACHDASEPMPSGGRPLGPQVVELADAAPADAYESPRRDGALDLADAAPGASDAALPPGPDAHGSTGLDEAACNACDEASCRHVDDLDLYAACFLVTEPATDGPGAGTSKATLCQAVLHCARVTGCAAVDPQACYCGPGVTDLQCLAGNAAGACKHEVEVAAESSNSGTIAERLSDPSYASGAAFNLLRYCETPTCGTACSGGGGPVADAGPGVPDAATPLPPDAAAPPRPDAALPPRPDAALPHPCADLDGDTRPDCEETLLANAAFDDDAGSWSAEFGASQSWDRVRDGVSTAFSGSVIVANTIVVDAPGITMTGSSQCAPTLGGAGYHLAAHVFVPAGQGAGSAALNVQYFTSLDCTGPVSGAWSSDATSASGVWSVLATAFTAPPGSASLRVRLVVVKDFAAPAFQARFDDVLLEKP